MVEALKTVFIQEAYLVKPEEIQDLKPEDIPSKLEDYVPVQLDNLTFHKTDIMFPKYLVKEIATSKAEFSGIIESLNIQLDRHDADTENWFDRLCHSHRCLILVLDSQDFEDSKDQKSIIVIFSKFYIIKYKSRTGMHLQKVQFIAEDIYQLEDSENLLDDIFDLILD